MLSTRHIFIGFTKNLYYLSVLLRTYIILFALIISINIY